jgi:hypothetical protein
MQKIAFALSPFGGAIFAADRQVTYQGDLSPLNSIPSFDHGYVIVWDRNNDGAKQLKTISVFGPDRFRVYQTAIGVPNQKYLSLLNGAADTDGTVAVVFRKPADSPCLTQAANRFKPCSRRRMSLPRSALRRTTRSGSRALKDWEAPNT